MLTRARKLLETAPLSELEKAELANISAAVSKWSNDYRDKPIAANLKEYTAAKAALEAAVRRIWPVHFPEEPLEDPAAADPVEVLLSQAQAKRELRQAGLKVSDGKLSMDWGDRIALKREGKAPVSALIVYAATLRGADDGDGGLSDQKLKKEIEKLDLDNERKRIDNRREDARWALRDDMEIAAAVKCGLLADTILHRLRLGQGRLIHIAGGDMARGPEYAEEVEQMIRSALNEVAASATIDLEIGEAEE